MSSEHVSRTQESKDSLSKQPTADVLDSEKASHDDIQDIRGAAPVKGDDSDGRVVWTWKQIAATMALCGLYVGSQVPLFFSGGSLSFIAADVGGLTNASWIPVVYSLVFAAVSSLCDYLQDIFGRRNITIAAGAIVIIGTIITAIASGFVPVVIGVAITGAGASPRESTALAGMLELVPVNKRGIYLAIVTFTIFPFTPFVIYCQLLRTYHTWRWTFYICIMVNGLSLAGTVVFYFPLSQTRAPGETTKSILKKIDYIGAILSMGALTLILLILQSAGQTHAWHSAYVICNLTIGLLLTGAFGVWEWKFAKFPIIPHDLFAGQRVVTMCLVICFVVGIALFAVVNFFPLLYSTVFLADPVQVGVKRQMPPRVLRCQAWDIYGGDLTSTQEQHKLHHTSGSFTHFEIATYHDYAGVGADFSQQFGYSQAVRVGNLTKLSGQAGWDEKGEVPKDVSRQVELSVQNVEKALKAVDPTLGWKNLVQVRSFHTDIDATSPPLSHQFKTLKSGNGPVWMICQTPKMLVPGIVNELEIEAYVEA